MSYTRFVLLSHLRSGTHFLRTSLDSHPAIVCQSEFFNSNRPNLPYPLTTPTEEILRLAFPEQPPAVRAVGFTLHAYHPDSLETFPQIRPNPRWRDVWDRLAAMPGLRVVHLERRNLLRRHLSQLLAFERWYWHRWDPEKVRRVSHVGPPPPRNEIGQGPPETDPIEIDLDRLVADFREVEQLRRRALRRLGHHEVLAVSYERLCSDYAAVCGEVLRFLGIAPRRLAPAVSRLETPPLSEAIANYGAVRSRLEGTRWAGFLDS